MTFCAMKLCEGLASRFVAGFIGSPSMSFLCGTKEGKVDEVEVQNLSVAPADQGRMRAGPGVTIGARPEPMRWVDSRVRDSMPVKNIEPSDVRPHFFGPETGGRF